jgi:hypothetical protein
MFRQLLFIEGKHLGEAWRKKELHGGELQAPLSLQFYCPQCGDVWAKAPITFPDGTTTAWLAYRAGCRKHPQHYSQPGGTLFLSWLAEFSEALTEGALRRELDLWWNFIQGTENEHF